MIRKAKKPQNVATESSPAESYQERLEQALMWAMWALSCDQAGHGGVSDAVNDMVPEFNMSKLKKKGYPLDWPRSNDAEED